MNDPERNQVDQPCAEASGAELLRSGRFGDRQASLRFVSRSLSVSEYVIVDADHFVRLLAEKRKPRDPHAPTVKKRKLMREVRPVRVLLKRRRITMCEPCVLGKHNCQHPGCLCVCNEVDFPWPPVEDQEPKEIPV